MKRRPALFLLVFALLGAWFGIMWPKTWWMLALGSVVLLLCLYRNTAMATISVLLFTLFITAFKASHEVTLYDAELQTLRTNERIWEGVILDVSQQESGAKIAHVRVRPREDSSALSLTIRLVVNGALIKKPLYPGHAILLRGVVKPFLPKFSTIHFDGYRYGLVRGVHGVMSLSNESSLWVGPKIESAFFATCRTLLEERILRLTTPKEASILLALMIGKTDLMSDSQEEVYRINGAQHLLAVSGLQVTLLGSLCYFLLTPLCSILLGRRFRHRSQAIASLFTLMVLFVFIGVCGFSSSSVRAFLMALCLALPVFFARTIDVIDALLASCCITILLMPLVVLDAGFWLSYAAVLGILGGGYYSSSWRHNILEHAPVAGFLVSLGVATMAAFLATLPVVLLIFGGATPFGLLANMVLVPLASLTQVGALVLGFISIACNSSLLIKGAAWCGSIIEIVAEFLAELAQSLGLAQTQVGPWLFVIVLVVIIASVCLSLRRLVMVLVASILIYGCYTVLEKPALMVNVIPVGQGDATLFSLPQGQKILIDAGGQPFGNFDPGAQIVVPSLLHKGVKVLDVLIISHPDPDHLLGAFAVMDAIPIKEIWHSGYSKEHPLVNKLLEKAKEKNIIIKQMPDLLGVHDFGDVRLFILAPNTKSSEPYFAELSANDNSVVVRITYGPYALLWPGDLEQKGEAHLLSLDADLEADIVKAPHHGSKTSSTESFIKAIKPQHVIYTTGRDNRFHFPHDEVIERYNNYGIQQWNTAYDGEIAITIFKHDLRVKGFLSRQKAAHLRYKN